MSGVPDDFDEESPLTSSAVPASSPSEATPAAVAPVAPTKRWKTFLALFVFVAAVAVAMILAVLFLSRTELTEQVTEAALLAHLVQLEACAMISPTTGAPSRDPRSGGFNRSADYIAEQLKDVPCDIRRQTFESVQFHEWTPPSLSLHLSPSLLSLAPGSDFATMRYGGDGVFAVDRAPLFVVIASSSLCNASLYVSMAPGSVALVDVSSGVAPPSCDLINVALLAQKSGASGVVLMGPSRTGLNGARVRKPGYLAGDELMQIPVFTIRYTLGLLMASQLPPVSLSANLTIFRFETFNLLCQTHTGNSSSVVAFGAHLDSVPFGPGINDDGSGSVALLEMARIWSGSFGGLKHSVLFAFWGSEEEGLIGSRYFGTNVTAMNSIVAYINMDMLGSPNGVLSVNAPGKFNNSERVANLIAGYLTDHNLPFNFASMGGGSDFMAFNDYGIPTSGVATGAGSLKSVAERALFGGLANAPYDPCYHQACDTVANVNTTLLLQLTRACFSAAISLATSS